MDAWEWTPGCARAERYAAVSCLKKSRMNPEEAPSLRAPRWAHGGGRTLALFGQPGFNGIVSFPGSSWSRLPFGAHSRVLGFVVFHQTRFPLRHCRGVGDCAQEYRNGKTLAEPH